MIYLHIFMAFFLANILGYGGGPGLIPLIEFEVVNRYGWLTSQEFTEILALANVFASPLAPKLAGYIGYKVGGVGGSLVAIFATVVPSLILMIVFIGTLYRYRNSPQVRAMSLYVKPVITVLVASLTYKLFDMGIDQAGLDQTFFIGGMAFILMERLKLPIPVVIFSGMAYGAVFLS